MREASSMENMKRRYQMREISFKCEYDIITPV
jgi:hypothetical protein